MDPNWDDEKQSWDNSATNSQERRSSSTSLVFRQVATRKIGAMTHVYVVRTTYHACTPNRSLFPPRNGGKAGGLVATRI